MNDSARSIRLITFDLDDTLWPVAPVIIRAEHRMRDYLDTHAPEVNRRFDRDALMQLRERLLTEQPELLHDISSLRHRMVEATLTACGYANAPSLAAGAFAAFLDARHDIEYFEDALDTLDHLSRRYTLGALSNGNANVARLGLDRYFAFHLSAESVGRRKPHPEMFERALLEAGVAADAAVHVGDHAEDDIRGAHEVGMATVWVNRSGTPWELEELVPTWEICDLKQLAALF